MKKTLFFLLMMLSAMAVQAKGLRYSVCQVSPEYTTEERDALSDFALLLSRLNYTDEQRFLQQHVRSAFYGSGVVVNHGGPCVLTARSVVGYAAQATVVFYLHDKTLRYRGCEVLGVDTVAQLALVRLPADTEAEMLSLLSSAADDDTDISAAGFSYIDGKPCWQLSKGYVSNAHFLSEGSVFLQHTAPVNPGMEGGPLLRKTDSVYAVAGINVGRASGREGIAMSVPLEQVRPVVSGASLTNDHEPFARLVQLGVEGVRLLTTHISKDEAENFVGNTDHMPLDLFMRIVEKEEEHLTVKNGQVVANAKTGLVRDIHRYKFQLFYHNYISANDMEVGLGLEVLGKRRLGIFGLQISSSLMGATPESAVFPGVKYNFRIVPALQFGLTGGCQVPLRVANQHVLIPRITETASAGPSFHWMESDRLTAGGVLAAFDSRAGIEYRYEMDRKALILGIDYTARLFLSGAYLPFAPVREIDGSTINGLYFVNGLGLRVGLAF